ncbi:hypothetical protein PVA98_30525 [Achromobacter xylosoxidans]|nr:hypothetical protein [Achromobacter xylosoxidans]
MLRRYPAPHAYSNNRPPLRTHMTRFLKTGLLLALVFGVVWLAVIIWWQESRTLPTGLDIGLYLFALPLALIAAGGAGRRNAPARRAVIKKLRGRPKLAG